MIGRHGTTVRRRAGAFVALVALTMSVLGALAAPSGADHEGGHVLVTPLDGSQLNKCQGAMPTPGSENTDKRLVGGTLVPGGTAVFEFTYPFDPTDENGREDFVILDCVFVDGEPAQAFELHGVPNDVSPFVFQFTVDIPEDIEVGAEFCNVGKTTAAPSSSQASNRKAGPACFVIGGDLRVVKVDQAGAPLTGATFEIECEPSSELLPVIIEGTPRDTYTGTTGDDNAITIAGPVGTDCVITETAAPAGYLLATLASVTVTIGVDGPDVVFTNPRATGDLVITKVSDTPGTFTFTVNCPGSSVANQPVTVNVATAGAPGTTSAPLTGVPTGTVCTVTEAPAAGFQPQPAQTVTIALGTNTVTFRNVRQTGSVVITKVSDTPGTFTFTVNCPGTSVANQQVTVTVATAGAPGTSSAPIAGLPTGTVCTVTEATAPGFAPQPAQSVTVAQGVNTVTFTNVRLTGALVVAKTTVGGAGTFSFTVDCNPGTAFDQTFSLTNTETRRITGIPTGTTCTVTEAATAFFTSTVTPANGAVVIATGDNVVSFTNTARPPVLAVTKTADAASVTAGTGIGFTVTVTNTGTGPATAVTLSDPMPATAGVSWGVSPAYGGPGTCAVTGAVPNQTLSCSFGDLAPGAGASVHLVSATSAGTSGTLTNTATARASNHGPVSATAAVTVNAPPVVLGQVVTNPPAPVFAGETLPRTGLDGVTMAATGLGFIGAGLVFRRLGRRRPARVGVTRRG